MRLRSVIIGVSLYGFGIAVAGQGKRATFHVTAFYTAKNDPAPISFVHEANRWFSKMSRTYPCSYDSTGNWDGGATEILSRAIDETAYTQPTLQQLINARGTDIGGYHLNPVTGWIIKRGSDVVFKAEKFK
jgi:hypothetical protein